MRANSLRPLWPGLAGVISIVTTIRWWWRQPDHFDWISAYVQVRRMSTMTRSVVCIASLFLGVVPFTMLLGSRPPVGTVGMTLSVVAGIGGFAGALLWLTRFPTRNQSIAYSVVTSASIACAVLAQTDPLTAILGCTAFATISGYIALFHTAAQMVANLALVVAVSAVPMGELVQTDGVVRAASAYGVMLVVSVAVPYGVQIIVHTLGVDLLRADRDPLTGLYNRRAFYRRTAGLAAAGNQGYLVIAMIDLDKFKRLNDTHGHTQGDRALAAVGRILRDRAPHGSVIGRAGGEEFLVALVVTAIDAADSRPVAIGQTLSTAIEELPFPITASVGTACVSVDEIADSDDPYAVITAAVAAADAAMYEAKRNGGNRTRHHDPQPSDNRRRSSPTTQRSEALPAHEQSPPAPAPAPANGDRRRRDSDRSASW